MYKHRSTIIILSRGKADCMCAHVLAQDRHAVVQSARYRTHRWLFLNRCPFKVKLGHLTGYENVEGYKRISEYSELRITTLSRYKLAKPVMFTILNCFKNM